MDYPKTNKHNFLLNGLVIISFLFSCMPIQAQDNKPLLDYFGKTIHSDFYAEEFDCDKTFISSIYSYLNTIDYAKEFIQSYRRSHRTTNINVHFLQIDTPYILIRIMLSAYPSSNAVGFYPYQDCYFWIDSPFPQTIVKGFTNVKRHFVYNTYPNLEDIIPTYHVEYNIENNVLQQIYVSPADFIVIDSIEKQLESVTDNIEIGMSLSELTALIGYPHEIKDSLVYYYFVPKEMLITVDRDLYYVPKNTNRQCLCVKLHNDKVIGFANSTDY